LQPELSPQFGEFDCQSLPDGNVHVDGRFPMNDSGRVYDMYSSFFNKTPSIAFGKLPTNQGIVVGNLELFDVNGSAAAGQYRHFRRRRANGAPPCSTRPPWRETERPYSNPEAAEELVQACLLIARCKARAYARRLSAARGRGAYRLTRDVELADATCVFHRVLSDIRAVPMLPDEFIV
jgi:hypothetical protein